MAETRNTTDNSPSPIAMSGHAIIAGYGVPGRAFAEWMTLRKLPHVVIEKNESIVERCSATGTIIIAGDVRSEERSLMRGSPRQVCWP